MVANNNVSKTSNVVGKKIVRINWNISNGNVTCSAINKHFLAQGGIR
jgi:hypothetical protein